MATAFLRSISYVIRAKNQQKNCDKSLDPDVFPGVTETNYPE
jgi:hypothetical protein